MANVIRTQTLIDSTKRALVKCVVVSDGTQIANSVIIDAATLSRSLNASGIISTTDRRENYRTSVKRIYGSVSGDAYAKLQWDGDNNPEFATVSGNFEYNFDVAGGGLIVNNNANTTGNILLSTGGVNANTAMTIFIDLVKNNEDYDAGQSLDPVAFNQG